MNTDTYKKYTFGYYEFDSPKPRLNQWFKSKKSQKVLGRQNGIHNIEKRQQEILEFSKELQDFKLSFSAISSVAQGSDSKEVLNIAQTISNNDELSNALYKERKLPINLIKQYIDTPKQFLKKNEPVIIGLSVLFKGNYQYLKEYIKG